MTHFPEAPIGAWTFCPGRAHAPVLPVPPASVRTLLRQLEDGSLHGSQNETAQVLRRLWQGVGDWAPSPDAGIQSGHGLLRYWPGAAAQRPPLSLGRCAADDPDTRARALMALALGLLGSPAGPQLLGELQRCGAGPADPARLAQDFLAALEPCAALSLGGPEATPGPHTQAGAWFEVQTLHREGLITQVRVAHAPARGGPGSVPTRHQLAVLTPERLTTWTLARPEHRAELSTAPLSPKLWEKLQRRARQAAHEQRRWLQQAQGESRARDEQLKPLPSAPSGSPHDPDR